MWFIGWCFSTLVLGLRFGFDVFRVLPWCVGSEFCCLRLVRFVFDWLFVWVFTRDCLDLLSLVLSMWVVGFLKFGFCDVHVLLVC